jgi:hypothetical protein
VPIYAKIEIALAAFVSALKNLGTKGDTSA